MTRTSIFVEEEHQRFRRRVALILVLLALGLALIVVRLASLQITEGAYYRQVAQGNRIRIIPQGGPRGLIYDRHRTLLASNRPAYHVQIIPEDTPDISRSLHNLSVLIDTPLAHLQERVVQRGKQYPFKPLRLATDVGSELAGRIESYQAEVPGISVQIEPRRLYPLEELGSHVVGYVGEIDQRQLQKLSPQQIRSARIVGRSGTEGVYNNWLIGIDGGRQVEVDHLGRELRVLGDPVLPTPGHDVYLTLDLALQRKAAELLGENDGVILALRPQSGEVLAMVSQPRFDPNRFVGGIGSEHWNRLSEQGGTRLFNKAIRGLYATGSTFKMVVALAALEEGLIDFEKTYNCPGHYRINRRTWYCHKRSGHGLVNVVDALGESCNVFFYQLGFRLGLEKIAAQAERLGFGVRTGIELMGERSGLVPSRAWKQRTLHDRWYDGETVSLAIGQGYLSATPLQLANYVNALANRQSLVRPTILQRVIKPDGQSLAEKPLPRGTRSLDFNVEHLDLVRAGMIRAVVSGTARGAHSELVSIAGKTGTAQVVGRQHGEGEELPRHLQPHAWFVGFAPAREPQITVLVLVENGGSGGRTAAPLAKQLIEFALARAPQGDHRLQVQHPEETTPPAPFTQALRRSFPPLPSRSTR